jgi:hypothetical protein
MCSTDIEPNRLVAAKAAALSFVENQDPNTQIGLVAFSGFAELVQPPTNDQEALGAAIKSLLTGRRTAIGSGILKALEAVAEADETIAPPDTSGLDTFSVMPRVRSLKRWLRRQRREECACTRLDLEQSRALSFRVADSAIMDLSHSAEAASLLAAGAAVIAAVSMKKR